ncbi:predicted aminomethyltransferase related to GcvT [Hahella chejuensis KCTC 2396]|uniref:Predicted aminomethyltransferase related to GcvT n=1 Tax=Hahella chejuensis (strain KCTC 2396) TaxID=349521 RepID=Q2SL44_HAHCH|nr:folate-binding protein YgfZ [Hahella chejuensis]ABC28630.1 predicted aminomethyltransferase related to GcvT [Hahella chejuensis KCTC 2396]
MTSFWNAFAKPANTLAPQESDGALHLHRLTNVALLEIKGPDAVKFMQGQFTCDIQEITISHSSLAACCTPKGRMVALFRIAQAKPDCYLLRLPVEVAQSFLAHLNKYKVFYKCTVTLLEDWGVIGLSGDLDSLPSLSSAVPTSADSCQTSDGLLLIRPPGNLSRMECWLDSAQASKLLPDLDNQCAAGAVEDWERLEVLSGLGEVYPQTLDEFIPQMLNLQALGAISFKKGCYTGQEIVARMQYLGTLKKRMFLLSSETITPAPGSAIIDETGARIGSVVRSAQGQTLAVLDKSAADGKVLRLEESPTTALQVLELPYAIEEVSNTKKKL